ncbi:MAG: hypothetical protein IJR95_00005 [Lachnospiraceae bacterium]|nr:hypothetical protein [Lachnospiraceae bacterium]
MRIISMLEDYREMCNDAELQGKFEAYKKYTEKYPCLFNAVQKYLYNCPLDALRDYIEGSDIIALLHQGETNYARGVFSQVSNYVDTCRKRMDISFPFDLYLGLELGNIGGASLPVEEEKQFVYIGMDRPIDYAFCDFFVPHELHHLLRIHCTGERDSVTLRARMVSEGLASYCPLWINDLPWNKETAAQSLGIKQESAQYMLEHADYLIKEMWEQGDKPLDQEIMLRFFATTDENEKVCVPGYFVGLWLTHALVEQGYDFMSLTKMQTSKVLSLMERVRPE